MRMFSSPFCGRLRDWDERRSDVEKVRSGLTFSHLDVERYNRSIRSRCE